MELLEQHRITYDALADEYDQRADTLRPVTIEAVEILNNYVARGRVLDVGCGSGLAMQVLDDYGFEAEGIDISGRMVEVARNRNPGLMVMHGDFMEENFDRPYDAVTALAFIHLYPKAEAAKVFTKISSVLKAGGILYLGTTEAEEASEGFEVKADYESSQQRRFRKHWTRPEMHHALEVANFNILDIEIIEDPYGKRWMDFVAEKPSS